MPFDAVATATDPGETADDAPPSGAGPMDDDGNDAGDADGTTSAESGPDDGPTTRGPFDDDSTDDGGPFDDDSTDDGGPVTDDSADDGVVGPECGNGIVERDEECDDANDNPWDGCDGDCTLSPDPCGPAPGMVIYVDAAAIGAGDGSSWADAYTSVASALEAAGTNDELWIAEGTYRSIDANTPVATLKTCVDLYGGFAGTEASIDERPSPLPATILSGDFAADDDVNGFEDNACNVIDANGVEYVFMDGLIVTAGRATVDCETWYGGGLYSSASILQLVDMVFVDNTAFQRGGGLYASASTIVLIDPVFEGNSASSDVTSGGGGGVHARASSSISLERPTFRGNTAPYRGGGIHAVDSTISMQGALFDDNHVTSVLDLEFGGGAIRAEGTTLTITASTFMNNDARTGGAIWTSGTAPVFVADCEFFANSASPRDGGAMNLSSPGTTTNVLFQGNFAADRGGAVYRDGHTHTLTNVQFIGNAAGTTSNEYRLGGGMALFSGTTILESPVFEDNTSAGFGGAIGKQWMATLVVEDAQFVNNVAGAGGGAVTIWGTTGGPTSLRRSEFFANVATGSDGGGAIYAGNSSTTLVDSCAFQGNATQGPGGAIHIEKLATGTVRDSTFRGNFSAGEGGAIRAVTTANGPEIFSSSFHDNTAASGGGIALSGGPNGTIRNVAIWGNGGGDMVGVASATITFTCSEGFLGPGVGNVLALGNPFVVGAAGELFLDPTSVCVDAGGDAAANVDYAAIGLDWTQLTTSMTGELDGPPVDVGAHYAL